MKTKTIYPASLIADFYKVAHRMQYPDGTEFVYSNWTPRSTYMKGAKGVIAFGLQAFTKKYLIEYFNTHFFSRTKEEVVAEYVHYIKHTLFVEEVDATHIADLHELGYLPLHIKAVKEGTFVPLKVPMATVVNTNAKFFWVTNYIETIFSSENWLPSTSATIAHEYKKLMTKYAKETGGDLGDIQFQGHDFSMRGMVLEAAILSGAGHLTSFYGTDTIPAIPFLEEYYNADVTKGIVGTSVNATEHSVMCAGGQENEYDTYERLITKVHPTGILSIVSDTWDLWNVLTVTLARLKGSIITRDGKVVVRPDSGNPVEILCGKKFEIIDSPDEAYDAFRDIIHETASDVTGEHQTGLESYTVRYKAGDKYYKAKFSVDYNRYDKRYYYVDGIKLVSNVEYTPEPSDLGVIEILWNIFGGTINEKGYKVLDPHIGAIYGDSITLERAEAICKGLKEKGFCSTNVVFGIGSFTYQYQTRDTFGFAMKATHVVINGEERNIQKDPATDTNKGKKSATGRLIVMNSDEGLVLKDGLTIQEQKELEIADELEDVFIDGQLVRDETLEEIRERIQSLI
ncbi:nicotinate phosphoribosyltransferase [Paenibacillus illinoisensis]|uniref:nicotinate phosphoribosyltransferase n=1 Tax=Paenibacillus illinoisensis TaxID=59845 RepID=UPI0030161419